MSDEPGNLAGLGKRLLGSLADGLILGVIAVPIFFLTGAFKEALAGHELTTTRKLLNFCLAFAVWVIVNARLLARKGQTIGKLAVGTRIVDLQGAVPPFGKLVILRYLVPWLVESIPTIGVILGLADGLFIFGRERRCIHDYLAGTRVVNA